MTTIDIRIQHIGQLFDSLDPSPFHENEKALSRDVENHIVDFAGEYGRAEPLRFIVHAPVSIKQHAAEITGAIHAHFALAHAQCRRRYRRRMRIGRSLLIAGIAVLGIALLLRALPGDPGDRAMFVAIGEGLLILGWVAMWRPLEILLFERLENHNKTKRRRTKVRLTRVLRSCRDEVGATSTTNALGTCLHHFEWVNNIQAGEHHDDNERFTRKRLWFAKSVENRSGSDPSSRSPGDASQTI